MKFHEISSDVEVAFTMTYQESIDLMRAIGEAQAELPEGSWARDVIYKFAQSVIDVLV